MSIRAFISFDIKKEERFYHMLIPNGAPYAEAIEALQEVIAIIAAQQKESDNKAAAGEALKKEAAEEVAQQEACVQEPALEQEEPTAQQEVIA